MNREFTFTIKKTYAFFEAFLITIVIVICCFGLLNSLQIGTVATMLSFLAILFICFLYVLNNNQLTVNTDGMSVKGSYLFNKRINVGWNDITLLEIDTAFKTPNVIAKPSMGCAYFINGSKKMTSVNLYCYDNIDFMKFKQLYLSFNKGTQIMPEIAFVEHYLQPSLETGNLVRYLAYFALFFAIALFILGFIYLN